MEKNKISLEICLGSSCYARGNGKLVLELQKQPGFNMSGTHCCGRCAEGPNLKIEGQWHSASGVAALNRILEDVRKKQEAEATK